MIRVLIVTNAAGGSMSGMEPGCAMLLDGYLNMTRLGLAEAWAETGGYVFFFFFHFSFFIFLLVDIYISNFILTKIENIDDP